MFYIWGVFGMIMPLVVAVITYILYYFIIRKAVDDSDMTNEIHWMRREMKETERRQAERFNALETHFQEQNTLMRERNELLIRQEHTRSQKN